jgi:hypothetical protein
MIKRKWNFLKSELILINKDLKYSVAKIRSCLFNDETNTSIIAIIEKLKGIDFCGGAKTTTTQETNVIKTTNSKARKVRGTTKILSMIK